jgi:hypothetical protein
MFSTAPCHLLSALPHCDDDDDDDDTLMMIMTGCRTNTGESTFSLWVLYIIKGDTFSFAFHLHQQNEKNENKMKIMEK